MKPSAPSYIERRADTELFEAVLSGDFCYVLTSRQMGKSSLMARTANRLSGQGIRTATVDLSTIGTDAGSTEHWYYGIAHKILRDLHLGNELQSWWKQRPDLPFVQRFSECLLDLVLGRIAEKVVIFVDEIDSTISLPFTDDFFAAIRACYNSRAIDEDFSRLNFVLLGVASPNDLIKDPTRTPFNIGHRVDLTDFTTAEVSLLVEPLSTKPQHRIELSSRITYWTGGHPYLTQKLCDLVASLGRTAPSIADVDSVVEAHFLRPEASLQEYNLSFVRDRLIKDPHSARELLMLYEKVRLGLSVKDDPLSKVQISLKLSGIVVPANDQTLRVRNPIYESVFTVEWAKGATPRDSGRIAVAGMALALLLAFWAGYAFFPREPTISENTFLVVDCLMPGQVRRLGTTRTYLTPRRPIRTTENDCEFRGGEYVAYDRATFESALMIWLPSATSGDPEAQYRVGTIYERGLDTSEDLDAAIDWYAQAAVQGHLAAAMRLERYKSTNLKDPLSNSAETLLNRLLLPVPDSEKTNSEQQFSRTENDTTDECGGKSKSSNEAFDFGRFNALVIGIEDYRYLADRTSAFSDVNALESVLTEKYGFQVQPLMDPTRVEILTALNDYRLRLTYCDNLLIYFDGHVQFENSSNLGYWAAADSTATGLDTWVPNRQIIDLIDTMLAKHVIVIAESFQDQTRDVNSSDILKLSQGTVEVADQLRAMLGIRARVALTMPVFSERGANLVQPSWSAGTRMSPIAAALVDSLEQNNDAIQGLALSAIVERGLGYANEAAVSGLNQLHYRSIDFAHHEGADFLFVPIKTSK